MQYFYRKAFVAFVLLLIACALLAWFCIYRSDASMSLMPRESGAPNWHLAPITEGPSGGSTVRLQPSRQESLSFDFLLSQAISNPWAAAAMVFDDASGKPAPANMSAYSSVTFLAKCAPANSLVLIITIADESVAQPRKKLSYRPLMTYFSCNEKGMPVSLDLTRLTVPDWWYDLEHIDLSRRTYKLDQVTRLEFAASQYSPRGRDSHAEISDLTLHGRDERYLVALAVLLAGGWTAFGIWFFRAQSRALRATLDSRLKKDLSFVAYRQLTLELMEDKEKAVILRFIAVNYANAGLDLDGVAAGTGTNRNKVNEVLKAELGMTFTGYLKKLRLTEASRLLSDNAGATVAEVAYSVGYANSSYFNKLFKEEYGCTAKEFRNLARRSEAPSPPPQAEL